MIERSIEFAALWWGHQFKLAMLWYDKAPAWVQLVVALLGVLVILAVLWLLIRDDGEWHDLSKQQRDRKRAHQLRWPKGVL